MKIKTKIFIGYTIILIGIIFEIFLGTMFIINPYELMSVIGIFIWVIVIHTVLVDIKELKIKLEKEPNNKVYYECEGE